MLFLRIESEIITLSDLILLKAVHALVEADLM